MNADVYIHPTSCVDEGAVIGAGSRIWHFSHIMSGAMIGTRCTLGQNVYIASRAIVGNNVHLQNNVSIYDGVTLEDDVFCGPSAVFTNVLNPRAHVSRKHAYLPTRVCKGASIGANATIVCGHTIGRYALVAAGAVVTRDVPDFGMIQGVPGKLCGWVCACGERLTFVNEHATCNACAAAYVQTGETSIMSQ